MITFTFNGKPRELDVASDTPLLWVIRDNFKAMGTKFGCGMGLCGACTVHLDGAAVRSCTLPVSAVAGRAVTTIEGSDAIEVMPLLRRAWIEHNVPQCGYCQPGQLMSAAALLAGNAQPSDGDIDAAMSGNLCRCGTYPRIRKAIHHAADLMAAAPNGDVSNGEDKEPSAQYESSAQQTSSVDSGKPRVNNFTQFVELKEGGRP